MEEGNAKPSVGADVEDPLMLLRSKRSPASDAQEQGERVPELLDLLLAVLVAILLLGELHGERLVGVVLLRAAVLVLGHVRASGEPPLAAGLAPEAAPRLLLAPVHRPEDLLCVVAAVRDRAAGAGELHLANALHGHALTLALLRADHLGQGVSVLQVSRVLPPQNASVLQLFDDDCMARLRLEHDIGAALQRPLLRLGTAPGERLDVLGGLGDLGLLVEAVLRGFLRRGDGKDRADLFGLAAVLRGAHLEAPHLVDAEPGPILSLLVEHRCGGLHDLLVLHGLGLEVGAGLQALPVEGSLGRRVVPALDLKGRRPGGGEEGAGAAHDEPGAEEVLLPLLPHKLLLFHQTAQAVHVRDVRNGGDEPVALVAAVGEAGVEHGLEQVLVLGREGRPRAVDAREESPPGGHLSRALLRLLGECIQAEAVEVQVHTLDLALMS
mmetsp:Transcript_73439/g.195127  ORF Transcript_73439/g.195127 Transcript_73439/m.195127 type:complete len:439 (+) Transcript_73439:99-1415(+)